MLITRLFLIAHFMIMKFSLLTVLSAETTSTADLSITKKTTSLYAASFCTTPSELQEIHVDFTFFSQQSLFIYHHWGLIFLTYSSQWVKYIFKVIMATQRWKGGLKVCFCFFSQNAMCLPICFSNPCTTEAEPFCLWNEWQTIVWIHIPA